MITFILIHREREVSSVAILVSFRGSKYKRSIGESVQVKAWNARTKLVRVTSGNTEASLVNDRIEKWRKAAERTLDKFKNARGVPDKDEFFAVLDNERFGTSDRSRSLLVPYFDTFIARYGGVRSVSLIKHYKGCKKTLQEYEAFIGRRLRFDDIDIDFYNRFTAWFNTKNLSLNYLGEKIKIIKVVMNDARYVDGLHEIDITGMRGSPLRSTTRTRYTFPKTN